jgi:hypothetical protein
MVQPVFLDYLDEKVSFLIILPLKPPYCPLQYTSNIDAQSRAQMHAKRLSRDVCYCDAREYVI